MISILTVSHNCLEWLELLVKSVRKFTRPEYEIVVVDNASKDGTAEWLKEQKDVKAILLDENTGHGLGLDLGLKHVTGNFCFVLDADAHVQRQNWDYDILYLYKENLKTRLIAAKGGGQKPIHPCFMFFETEFFLTNKLAFVAGDGHDVGRKIYRNIASLGYETLRIPADYEPGGKKFYEGVHGDEYYIYDKPTIYHNWYGARFGERGPDEPIKEMDGYKLTDHIKKKERLFGQSLVREILE